MTEYIPGPFEGRSMLVPEDIRTFFHEYISDQINLVAIHPEDQAPLRGKDFGTDAEAAYEWAMTQNAAGMNVYYHVNQIRPGINTKANKQDVVGIRFAHLDIDPPKARRWTEEERDAKESLLMNATLPPTALIWSGNGWQALWRVPAGATIAEVEVINKGLIRYFGGDVGTHNADRLFRVPGLLNYPTPKKRSMGRGTEIAWLADPQLWGACDDGE